MNKLGIILVALILCIAGSVYANSNGTTGADFLNIGLDARAVGMGEAVTGVVNGVEGLFWNPGALAGLNKIEATFMHLEYLEGIKLDNFGYGQRIDDFGVVGLLVESLNSGTISKTEIDNVGNLVARGQTYRSTNLNLGLGYSLSVGERQGIGVVFKSIEGKIDGDKAKSYALDLGYRYDLKENIFLGLAIQNLGNKFKYVSEGDQLPLRMRAGVGYEVAHGLMLGLDVVDAVNEGRMSGNFGMEYSFKQFVSVRLGYNSERVNSLGGLAGISAGLGVRFADYNIDYGFVPYGDLGNSHRVSWTMKF